MELIPQLAYLAC